MTQVWLSFLVGLAGGAHCLGMCGGIAAVISRSPDGSARGAASAVWYNLGRIVTYTALGFTAGMAGSLLSLPSTRTAGICFSIAANSLITLLGLGTAVGAGWGVASLEFGSADLLAAPLKRALAPGGRSALLAAGLLLGFLPCGLVYAPLMVAAATGEPLQGGLMMAALGLGTAPALLLAGTLRSRIPSSAKGKILRLAGLLVMLLGLNGLWMTLTKIAILPPPP